MDAAYDPQQPDAASGELDLAAVLMGIADPGPIPDDLGDPFADVPPEWKRLCDAALAHFALDELPRFLRPAAPFALNALALKLAADPHASRVGLLELIDEAVCALGITRDELGCWDAAGLPYAEPRARRARA